MCLALHNYTPVDLTAVFQLVSFNLIVEVEGNYLMAFFSMHCGMARHISLDHDDFWGKKGNQMTDG